MAIMHIEYLTNNLFSQFYLSDSEIKDLISGKSIELRIKNGISGGINRIFINRENNEEFDIEKGETNNDQI